VLLSLIPLTRVIFKESVIPDDLYHCKDPNATWLQSDLASISCDPGTYEWNLDELSPDYPPRICGGGSGDNATNATETNTTDFIVPVQDLSNIQDWFEPCVHWAMRYGNLATTRPPNVPEDDDDATDGT
jgi:hypothetical protein